MPNKKIRAQKVFVIPYNGARERVVIKIYKSADRGKFHSVLESSIKRNDKKNPTYSAAVDGMESLLLALASEGLDLCNQKVLDAVKTVSDVLGHEYSDL